MDVKEQIKRSVSIVDVVSLYVNLKPAGKSLKALCPFHTEKTPSFYVMPDKDTFACYGCNKFGDIFTFIQEIEHIGFSEAMNFLIDRFQVQVDHKVLKRTARKEIYQQINQAALKYFQENLLDNAEGKKAQEYLKQRGISDKTVQLFALGYAENRWDGLYRYLQKQSLDIEKAIELGLLVRNDAKRIYDRFRGRIIFPIYSESETHFPIAFGGRTIFDEPNKYLNSPDTPLYKKSHHLYGFHLSKHAVREKKSSILVEGYFDAVSLYQSGIENVAASLGTALTENQIYLLKRFSEDIYIFYDNDRAGIAAALRAIEKMLEQHVNPRIISLSSAKDPDDYVREQGIKAFYQLLDSAKNGFHFLLHHIELQYDTSQPEKKQQAVQAIMAIIEKIGDPLIRDEYTSIAADFFRVDKQLLTTSRKNPAPLQVKERMKLLNITLAERIFLESLLAVPAFLEDAKTLCNDDILSVLQTANIIRLLFQHYNKETKTIDDFSGIARQLSDAERGLFMDIYETSKSISPQQDKVETQIESSIVEFHKMLNKQQCQRIAQEIKIAERQQDAQRLQELLKRKYLYFQSRYQKNKEKHPDKMI